MKDLNKTCKNSAKQHDKRVTQKRKMKEQSKGSKKVTNFDGKTVKNSRRKTRTLTGVVGLLHWH